MWVSTFWERVRGVCPLMVRIVAMLVFAVLSLAVIRGDFSLAESPRSDVTYEVSGRVLARTHADGRVEFCFQPQGQDAVCPELRVVRPERVTADRWLTSSLIRWSVPIDPDRLSSPSVGGFQPGGDPGCEPNLEGMLASVWSVESKGFSTDAHYIGEGRFLAWSRLWSLAAPIVTLIRGSQSVAGAVVAVDADVDLALIEAHDPSLFVDEPGPKFRTPTTADLGAPVFMASRDDSDAAAATFGRYIVAVHADELRTRGGDWQRTGAGPLYDICGNLLAITWDGWDSWPEFAEASLARWLSSISAEWPQLPKDSSTAVNGDGRLAWYSGPEPPLGSECVLTPGRWWIGLAGTTASFLDSGVPEALGWEVTGTCYWERSHLVLSLDGLPPVVEGDQRVCVHDRRAEQEGRFIELLHRSSEPFGETRIVRLPQTSRCPWQFTHSLRVKLAEPKVSVNYIAHLVGVDGRAVLGTSPGRAYRGITGAVGSPTAVFWQRWDVPEDFVPAAVQMQIGRKGWRAAIQDPRASGPSIEQSARVAVRADSGGDLRVCLRPDGSLDVCFGLSEFTAADNGDGGWQVSPAVQWRANLSEPIVASALSEPIGAHRRCPVGEDVNDGTWLYSGGVARRTALYVGDGQFLVSADAIDGSMVPGILSRGDVAMAATYVATDTRSGLALLAAPQDWPLATLGSPVTIGEIDDRWEGQTVWLVAYDWSDSERFSVLPVRIGEVGEEVIDISSLHSGRRGAPLIHPCTGEVVGVHSWADAALTAAAVQEALERLRS